MRQRSSCPWAPPCSQAAVPCVSEAYIPGLVSVCRTSTRRSSPYLESATAPLFSASLCRHCIPSCTCRRSTREALQGGGRVRNQLPQHFCRESSVICALRPRPPPQPVVSRRTNLSDLVLFSCQPTPVSSFSQHHTQIPHPHHDAYEVTSAHELLCAVHISRPSSISINRNQSSRHASRCKPLESAHIRSPSCWPATFGTDTPSHRSSTSAHRALVPQAQNGEHPTYFSPSHGNGTPRQEQQQDEHRG